MSSKHDLVDRSWNRWLQSHNGQAFLKKMAENSKSATTPTPTANTTATTSPVKKS